MKIGMALPTSMQGVYLPSPFANSGELTSTIQLAERLGFYSAWVFDFMTPFYERHKAADSTPEWYEAMTSISYLAGVSERIMLGTACIQMPLRDPFLLARQAATLDLLSNGRCLLGVGLGQARSEFTDTRPRDARMHRGRLLEESLEALHRFFNQHAVTLEGECYQCHDLRLTPKPIQNPFPLYIAGRTEDTPKRIAKWGTGWLLSRGQADSVEQRIDSLLPHLEQAKRERNEIDLVLTKGLSLGRTHEKAVARFNASMLPGRTAELSGEFGLGTDVSMQRHYNQNLIGTPEEVAEQIDQVRQLGIDHLVVMYFATPTSNELQDQLQWFGEEVMPLL